MAETSEPQPDLPQEQGITLDELAAAYAQSMGGWAEPFSSGEEGPPEPSPPEAATDQSPEPGEEQPAEEAADRPPLPEEEEQDDDPCPLCPTTILEAMLFVGDRDDEPLTPARAAELMRGVSLGEIPGLVDELNRRYASHGSPYRIVTEGSGYRLSLHRAFLAVRNKFYGRVREARLSQATLDVLAIVAYRQPITAEEVTRLRDTSSGHILAQLVRRGLLRIERPPGKRRPVTYHTADRFLDLFDLESLDDLPQAEELEKG